MFEKAEAVMELYTKLIDFARYPLNIYGVGWRFVLSFVIPVAIGSFYPVDALLRGMSLLNVLILCAPVAVLLVLAVTVWNTSIKRYKSAGG